MGAGMIILEKKLLKLCQMGEMDITENRTEVMKSKIIMVDSWSMENAVAVQTTKHWINTIFVGTKPIHYETERIAISSYKTEEKLCIDQKALYLEG